MYSRILVKLSGEAMAAAGKNGILDDKALLNTAKAIKSIYDLGAQVSIVIGAGNICRGAIIEKIGINRVTGDYMGMLGTTINCFALSEALKNLGLKAVVLSAIRIESFCEKYSPKIARKYLKKGYITLFAAGTGKPYFTTDTCASLRAIEINANAILIAKNGVDGVYDSDPRINKKAKMFKEITCSEIIKRKLQVMDLSAIKMLKDKDIDIRVFNMAKPSNFIKVTKGENVGTIVKKG